MFQDNPDQFDTDEIDVRYVERGCLIVWTESSQYDLENEDKLKKDCIQFTKNMFEKCSLDSTESTNIKVNVKFSKTFQDSSETKDDHSDYLQCGTCRQEFFTINSFISHKKECIRNRKISKQKQEDISKLPQISEESPETISRTRSDSTNQFISSQNIMEDWNEKLIKAAQNGKIEDVKLSLQNGADIEYKTVSVP
ncbi:ZFHX4 [Mytilus edulis]|uniref:ZFHX4 n=1 Tax=Mytilus edulis TaxID=6550 RepID=A0A8S3U018_MYTED|nr:ZFHX4 [Mytilus edulis]